MEKCFDEGTLQAFLDNELDPELAGRVARHVTDCESCADLLAVVEEETAFVFGALEPELNTLVPTQRLWNRISDSIRDDRPGLWQRLIGPVNAMFARMSMPAIAAVASVVIVAGSFVILSTADAGREDLNVASGVRRPTTAIGTLPKLAATIAPAEVAANEPEEEIRAVHANIERTAVPKARRTVAAASRFVRGEETYVKTIAQLEKTVDANKDSLLSPSARYSYEKNLAVVNDSIERMRREVRSNPKSDAARQILFNSYKDKIDLLNSVNERGELMASLR